jgi:hypothetical protein
MTKTTQISIYNNNLPCDPWKVVYFIDVENEEVAIIFWPCQIYKN